MHITTRALSGADTDAASVHYEAGFIVLSYLISTIGCISALELLHRRTSIHGAYNWYLLIASSITMGGIGIWSMHFVGNRAIILANGQSDRQLSYNQGFTALSFFLPIMVLLVAFYVLAISGNASRFHVFIAGLLTGTAVCAMHYVGQVGIANYDCTYQIGNIVGAAIIAVTASLIALSVFFRLRNTWTDSWWKRGLCAALLAGAVSGMHWTAAVGTVYHLRTNAMSSGSSTRVQTVIFCAVLSVASCVLLLTIAFVTRRRTKVHKQRAQELVLACIYFDEADRVMVTNDGFLPHQKITNQFIRKTFGEDELSRSHPAFMWVYEASRNWGILRELVPGMQEQLNADPNARKYQPDHEEFGVDLSRTASADFNAIFKQLFCIAAEGLAQQINEEMEDLGVMFEEPLETGTTPMNRSIGTPLLSSEHRDAEKQEPPRLFGKGRYLFLNRRLNKSEAADFAATGYRFGSIFHVAESLARNMQVGHQSMLSRLERMKICISQEHLHPPGIHLACFLLRPNIQTGFDILVPTVRQNQLPLVTLPVTKISSSQMATLQALDEWTIRDILKELIPEQIGITDQTKDFRWQLYSAFVRLVDMVNDPATMMEARFSARPVQAPCRSTNGQKGLSTCTVFSIRYLGSIHSSYTQKDLTYVPFDFFNAQQQVETSAARHEVFRKRAHREFGHCLDKTRTRTISEARSIPGEDGLLDEGQDASSQNAQGPFQGILSQFGIKKAKRSRRSSRSGIFGGLSSGRSTAEPDTTGTSPATKKDLSILTDEVHELGPVPTSSPVSEQQKFTDHKESDEIELITLTDDRRTFVSELFTLFRLSNASEKGKIPKTG